MTRRAARLALLFTLAGVPTMAAQKGGFEVWAAAHAIPIVTVESGVEASDLRVVGRVIGNARVVALGEPAHGAHEPLAFRNRLFQYLVEEKGFTAIAIETGLPESRRIQQYVLGGVGDAHQVVAENLTWGFGEFGENDALVSWIRRYNADSAHARKIRFYGYDESLLGPDGPVPSQTGVDAAIAYLDRVDAPAAARMRAVLGPWATRLADVTTHPFSADEHARMGAAVDTLVAALERRRSRYVRTSGRADFEWAHRSAIVARQGAANYRVVPPDAPGGGMPPDSWRAVEVRDAAMAENIQWVLAQEGVAGKVMVFAHNAHVMNGDSQGGIWNAFARPPAMMGTHLRPALGEKLVTIGTSSAANGAGLPSATAHVNGLDAALATVGLPRFLVDLRAARSDSLASRWLSVRRPLTANFDTELMIVPARAFDAIVFLDTLTPTRSGSTRP